MSSDSTVNNTSVMTPSADQLKILSALEKQVALLRASFGLAPLEVSTSKRGSRKSKTAKNDAPASADKPKKEVNDKIKRMNEERMALFDELKRDWAARNPDFASLSDADLKKAVKNGEVEPRPRYPDALKLHSQRMSEANPEHAAKAAARRAKIDAKQAETAAAKKGSAPPSVTTASDAASTASAASGDKKKRGPKKYSEMTPEELAAAKAKRAAAKSSKKTDAPVKTAAPAPAPAPAPVSEPAPVTIVAADEDDETAFKEWTHSGTTYWRSGENYVYAKTKEGGFGAYQGRWDPVKRKIDKTVPEPDGSDSE